MKEIAMRIVPWHFLKIVLTFMIVAGLSFVPANTAQSEEKELINIPGDFSTTLGFVTDYRFRGLSQTDRHPAIQGSFDWAHNSGFYLGVWGSNVDFQEGALSSDGASTEFDLYGGYSTEIKGFTLDVGLLYKTYPGAANSLGYDFMEYNFTVGYNLEILSLSGGVSYAPDFYGFTTGDATYMTWDAEVPLGRNLTATAHVGRQWIDNNPVYNPDYTDYAIGVSYATNGFDISLQYVDTSISDTDCVVTDQCEGDVVFGISRSF